MDLDKPAHQSGCLEDRAIDHEAVSLSFIENHDVFRWNDGPADDGGGDSRRVREGLEEMLRAGEMSNGFPESYELKLASRQLAAKRHVVMRKRWQLGKPDNRAKRCLSDHKGETEYPPRASSKRTDAEPHRSHERGYEQEGSKTAHPASVEPVVSTMAVGGILRRTGAGLSSGDLFERTAFFTG